MRGYVEALQEILNPRLVVSNAGGLELTETQAGGGDPVRLTNPGRAICIHLDRLSNHEAFPWLDVSKGGISKICDYAVVVESRINDEPRTSVLLVELKSRHTDGASSQIANGFILMDWLVALARRHCGARGRLTYRGIVFAEKLPGRTKPRALGRLFETPSSTQEGRPIFRLPRKSAFELSALVQ